MSVVTTRRGSSVALMIVVTGVILMPVAGAAQSVALGLSGSTGLVVGEASDFLDAGHGVQLAGHYRLGARGAVSARASVAWLGLKRDRDAVSGNTAENGLVIVMAGPEVAVQVWRFEPFAYGVGGFTANRLTATSGGASTVSETSTALTWSAGAGLRFLLVAGSTPVQLEVSGSMVDPGALDFSRVNRPGQRITDNVAVLGVSAGVRIGL